ncbi:Pycsar system effector family protein [Streptomyces sp. NPDC046925]|uniref:Pycsar system effector family protein n=1 Tax=Streptomyces sp. NPDC046925 TaxID=3155375 RepID=UPI0033E1A578
MSDQDPNAADASARATETAWKIHAAIGEWTARVDAKASFALTLQSAAIAGILALSSDGHPLADLHGGGALTLLWCGIVLVMVGAVFAMLVVVPRLRAPKMLTEAPDNFIYFGHLMHREPGELALALQQKDPLPVLTHQLIMMSRIAWVKHRHVQWSFLCFLAGVLLVFLAGISH